MKQAKWKGLYGIAAAGLAVRIAFALAAENIHHPDELFQYQEQAHRLVFGYGYIPWEYRFGIRSWLLPAFISAPLYLCKACHMDRPTVYVPFVKIVFCTAATSLIFSVYVIARHLVSEQAGRLAALLAAFWYELIYFSFRPFTEVMAAYALFAALAFAVGPPRRSTPYLFGSLAGLGIALRILYLPVLPLLTFVALRRWNARQVGIAACSFFAVIVSAGYVDYLTWGGWFESYRNNYLFNRVHNVSALWGTEPFYWHVQLLLEASSGILIVALAAAFRWFGRLWPLLVLIAIVLGSHAAIAHKEYRHVFLVVPAMVALSACVAGMLAREFRVTRRQWNAAACAMLAVSVLGMFNVLPGETRVYRFKPLYASDPSLAAYEMLSSRPGLTGVENRCRNWWDTGGYYYLHRNVPLFAKGDVAADGIGATALLLAATEPCPAGFRTEALLGDIKICLREAATPRSATSILAGRPVMQPGIDGQFRADVKPRF